MNQRTSETANRREANAKVRVKGERKKNERKNAGIERKPNCEINVHEFQGITDDV